MAAGEGSPSLINCIVWEGAAEEPCGSAAATLTGTDPLFERPGTFDFTAASEEYYQPPQFIIDPGDYRLRPGSPAIDRGLAEFATAVDRDGARRPCGAGVDLGAYEAGGCGSGDRAFRRGEVNRDGRVDLSDPVAILSYLFLGDRSAVGCEKAADADDNGALDLTDPIGILNHLFLGAPPPPPPAAACGTDPTPDQLGCESPAACG